MPRAPDILGVARRIAGGNGAPEGLAFVSDVWRGLGYPGTISEFKSHLRSLDHSRQVILAKADMPQLYSRELISESSVGDRSSGDLVFVSARKVDYR